MQLEPELQEAIDSVIKNSKSKWAISYLEALPDVLEDCGSRALANQLLLALSNLQYWKGVEACRVKTILEKYIAQGSIKRTRTRIT